ncbi:MAG: hypothetical protein M5R40_07265 [Anaerolineae bacterium]|nr:hypothetical protein [Anaerolineae bacterium]
MWHLNHHAMRYSARSEVIYALKNQFIRVLYERGFCTRVAVERQDLVCWTCGGSGEYEDYDVCERCGGTGVYRSHVLYCFAFDVHGQRYRWRQPARLVDWPLTYNYDHNAPAGKYTSAHRNTPELDPAVYELYALAVYAFLRQAGVPARDLPRLCRLRRALRYDLSAWLMGYDLVWRLRQRLQRWRERRRRLRRQQRLQKHEIPF